MEQEVLPLVAAVERQDEAMCKHRRFTLTDLPAECLHLVCQKLPDNATKAAAVRSCCALRSTVLGIFTVLIQVTFPDQPAGPQDTEQHQRLQQQRHKQQARVLQQARQVVLRMKCDSSRNGWESQTLIDMYAWLGHMFQLCKGPLLSVCKLELQGNVSPIASLPNWMPMYCPNISHLKTHVKKCGTDKCDMESLGRHVYSKLRSIELVDLDNAAEDHFTAHVSALVDAPILTHVALGVKSCLKHSFAQMECHWKFLHLLDRVTLPNVAKLPWKGVEHLVLGTQGSVSYFTLKLVHASDDVHAVSFRPTMQDRCTCIRSYGQVTLSTDAGLVFDCSGVDAANAALALPLLQHARPYMKSAKAASGTLTISGLSMITLEFVACLCTSLPETIKRVGFMDCYSCTWEKGALAALMSLLPLHITGLALLDHGMVCWRDVEIACKHATRPIELTVPIRHITADNQVHMLSVNGDISINWPPIERSMQANGSQLVTLNQGGCSVC